MATAGCGIKNRIDTIEQEVHKSAHKYISEMAKSGEPDDAKPPARNGKRGYRTDTLDIDCM
jgi:hypothetical protein